MKKPPLLVGTGAFSLLGLQCFPPPFGFGRFPDEFSDDSSLRRRVYDYRSTESVPDHLACKLADFFTCHTLKVPHQNHRVNRLTQDFLGDTLPSMNRQIWFTADTHFGHVRIIEFHPNRGATVDEMNERMVENWNAVVGTHDTVYHLGDFAMGKLDDSLKFFHRLNGSKHLVAGNHDGNRTKKLPWASVSDLRVFKQKPYASAVMCHYPLLTWEGAHYGRIMLHGHCHGLLRSGLNEATTRMDVGIDTHPEFRPYNVDEIAEIMSTRTYEIVDAHA